MKHPDIARRLADLGITIRHPKAVATAIDAHQRLHAFLSQPLPSVAELAASGDIEGAVAAAELARNIEAVRSAHSVGVSERNLDTLVASHTDDYLKQAAKPVAHAVEQLTILANQLPIGADYRDLATAVRGRYADRLGEALDHANTLLTYTRLVKTLTRVSMRAAPILTVDDHPRFAGEHGLQDRVDRLHATATSIDGADLIEIANSDSPFTINPVFKATEVHDRADRWARVIADAGQA